MRIDPITLIFLSLPVLLSVRTSKKKVPARFNRFLKFLPSRLQISARQRIIAMF